MTLTKIRPVIRASVAAAVVAVSMLSIANVRSDLPYRHYAIPAQNYALFPPAQRPPVVLERGGVLLARMTPADLNLLTQLIHERRASCGGFVDAEDEMQHFHGDANLAMNSLMSSAPRHLMGDAPPRASHPNEVAAVMNNVRPDRFVDDWKQLTAFPNRYSRGEMGPKTTQWLQDRMLGWAKEAGRADIQSRVFKTGDGYTQDSVAIRIPGANPQLPGVLVGGHMDTFADVKPGVDDDASGSSTVMEVYRAVLDSKLHFARDMYFVFYAAEELGLVGSKRVAREFEQQKIALRGVLQFDMTSYRAKEDRQDIFFITDNTDPELSAFTRDLAIRYLNMPADRIGKTACGYACSDHASWHKLGYASVFPFEADSSRYNPRIHTPRDDWSLADVNHAMNFVKLGAAFMVEMAEPAGAAMHPGFGSGPRPMPRTQPPMPRNPAGPWAMPSMPRIPGMPAMPGFPR